MKLKTVIFDFDGVISDSFSDTFGWLKGFCEESGKTFPYSCAEEFKKVYKEPPFPEIYENLGYDWKKDEQEIRNSYRQHKAQTIVPLFPRIKEVIEEINGRLDLAIASSNIIKAIHRQTDYHDITEYFKTIVGQDDLPKTEEGMRKTKPDPDCILIALERLSISPSEVVYIGDQLTDVKAVRRASKILGEHIPIIGVTYGFTTKEKWDKEEFRPDIYANTPESLLDIL